LRPLEGGGEEGLAASLELASCSFEIMSCSPAIWACICSKVMFGVVIVEMVWRDSEKMRCEGLEVGNQGIGGGGCNGCNNNPTTGGLDPGDST